MKKFISISCIVVICVALLIGCAGCEKEKSNPLRFYDFSFENVEEVGYVLTGDGGNAYGTDNIWRIKKGDKRIETLAAGWSKFQKEDIFVETNKNKKAFQTGGSITYVCILKNETVRIKRILSNLVEVGGHRYEILDEAKFKEFMDLFNETFVETDKMS